MEHIFKYPVSEVRTQEIEMPIGAVILSVQVQGETPCMWAKVDTSKRKVKRKFTLVGTGWELPEDADTFIGTFQLFGGKYVFHLFECKNFSE